MEYTPCNSLGKTTAWAAASTKEARAAAQTDLDRLEKWADKNLMSLKKKQIQSPASGIE